MCFSGMVSLDRLIEIEIYSITIEHKIIYFYKTKLLLINIYVSFWERDVKICLWLQIHQNWFVILSVFNFEFQLLDND